MHHAQKERRTLPPFIEPGQYRIAGKFGGQKICQIVLEAKKIKFGEILIWRIPADVLPRIHKHAHMSMCFW